jgi:transcriptional regulator with XRE-family HTH domain
MRVDEINRKIGEKLKQFRTLYALSQQELGDVLGVSPQQIQKFEKGLNRIKAADLYIISKRYGHDIKYFFNVEGLEVEKVFFPDFVRSLTDNQILEKFNAIKSQEHKMILLEQVNVLKNYENVA